MLQTIGRRFIQLPTESASLIGRPVLAAQEWISVADNDASVADYYTRIKEYCLNPMEVLESKGYQRETFPF
jgi:hypothetical protein